MGQESFQFFSPQFLWFLLLAPVVYWFDLRRLHLLATPLSSQKILRNAKQKTWRQRLEFLPTLFKTLAFVCLVVALARPQYVSQLTQVKSEGIDIFLTLDTSLSMQALDMRWNAQQVTRLQAVKAVATAFILGRQTDRIGMVIFGQVAYTQCPLTLDYGFLTGFLDMIDAGIAGQGTAIGNGLATAVKRLLDSKAKSKVIILLTDGRNEAGDVSPMAAAELAAQHNIKVYTIGVGSSQNYVPILLKDSFGAMYTDVKALGGIDTELLQQIAEKTGGQFFRAQTTEILQEVYKKIDTLEKTEVELKRFQLYDERFFAILCASLILYVAQWILRATVFLRIP